MKECFCVFDEANFWEHSISGADWKGSPYDNFRNSRIRTFSAKKIDESPSLSAQYRTGIGLLRSFASNQIAASEIFDVESISSYLAVLELWGSWHGIQWNDIRFYLDPLTMKLEPIGYDAHPRRHSDIKAITLRREPMFDALLQDPLIRNEYLKKLRKLCRDVTEGDLGNDLVAIQQDLLSKLRHEFFFTGVDEFGKTFRESTFPARAR